MCFVSLCFSCVLPTYSLIDLYIVCMLIICHAVFMISIFLWTDDFVNGVTQGHHKWISENFAMFTFETGTNRNCCESESVQESVGGCMCVYVCIGIWEYEEFWQNKHGWQRESEGHRWTAFAKCGKKLFKKTD